MPSKLAVQTYTIRDFLKTEADLRESMRKVREIGYEAVQLSGVGCMNGDAPEVSAATARQILDEQGIACIATHRNWAPLLADPETEIAFHKTLGCDYVAIGGLPNAYFADEAGAKRFLAEAETVLPRLADAGLRFGYHNHAHEFARVGSRGERWIDLIIGGDPRIAMEFDVYWVAHAGANPERFIERCGGRVPVIHFKDKEVVPVDGPVMAPIGEGNLDWANLIPACEKAGVEWYAVEQDTCRRDPFDCLRSSFDFLTANGL
jgi:sugar phosphate isomerase/epimerase